MGQLPTADRIVVSRLFSASGRIDAAALDTLVRDGSRSQLGASRSRRVELIVAGLLIRAIDVHDHVNSVSWRTSLLFSLACEASAPGAGARAVHCALLNCPDLAILAETYARFVDRLLELHLVVPASSIHGATPIATADPEAAPGTAFERAWLKVRPRFTDHV